MSNARELSKLVVGGEVSAGGVDDYADVNALPGNPSLGDLAFITGTNTLYVYNGSAWFNIAIANQAPTAITGNQASYALALDGTPTVVTLVSNDPEGFPLTWSATTSGDTQVGTLTQADNIFTITPSTDEADVGTLSVTFSVTDGNNTETSFSSFTLAFLSPYWDETILSIGTSSTNGLDNSTFIDRSTNAHTVTPSGSPVQTAFHPYLDYYGIYLDGSSWYSVIDNFSDFQFDTGDYTAEIWVKPDDTSTGSILGVWSDTNAGNQMWYIQQTSAGFRHWIDPADTIINQSDASDVVPGKWTHIAITRSGSTFRMFIDGTKVSEATSAGYNMQEGGGYLTVGRSENGSYFNGYVADAHVIKGYAKYTSDFDMPTEPVTAHANTKFLAFRKNRIYDESSSSHSIGVNGSPKVVAHNPFGQGSEYAVGENKGSAFFDETSSEYLIADLNTLNNIDITWTIECWAYPTTDGSPEYIIGFNGKDGGNDYIVGVTATILNGSSKGTQAAYILAGQWNHVALTCDGTTITLWINGVSRETESYTGANPLSNCVAAVGCEFDASNGGGPGNYFNGYISDWGVSDTCKYTTEFTPPTSPVSADADVLYVPMDNTGIFDKTGNSTLTLNGNTTTSTTQTKFADTAMYFDGNGDYITIDSIGLGSGDFTVEFWFNPSLIDSNYKALIDFRSTAAGNPGVWIHNTNKIYYYAAEAQQIIGTTTLSQDTWYHAAACRSDGVTKLFLNGNQESGSYNDSGNYTAGVVHIGRRYTSTEYYYNGYIENLQILRGVAKYTTNFTPPTKTQGRTYQAES